MAISAKGKRREGAQRSKSDCSANAKRGSAKHEGSQIVNVRGSVTRFILGVLLPVVLPCFLSACAGGGASWDEEILLTDNRRVIVKRSLKFGNPFDTELGTQAGGPPVRGYRLEIPVPGTVRWLVWDHDESLIPMALGFRSGTAYLATAPRSCNDFDKYGRPQPPYVFFRFENGWKRIPIDEFPSDIKTSNLLVADGRRASQLAGAGFVSAEQIRDEHATKKFRGLSRIENSERYSSCLRGLESIDRYRREKQR